MDTPKYKVLKDWDGHVEGDLILDPSSLPEGTDVDALVADGTLALATEEDLNEAKAEDEGVEEEAAGEQQAA